MTACKSIRSRRSVAVVHEARSVNSVGPIRLRHIRGQGNLHVPSGLQRSLQVRLSPDLAPWPPSFAVESEKQDETVATLGLRLRLQSDGCNEFSHALRDLYDALSPLKEFLRGNRV